MEPHNQSNQSPVSEREKEVLLLLAKGYSTKMIAEKLYISITTVKSHREHLKKKLSAKNTPELISIAWNLDLL